MSTNEKTRTLNIKIRAEGGMFFATSEDEPQFFLAQTSPKALMDALPAALEESIRGLHHMDVAVSPARKMNASSARATVFPRERLLELAAQ